ncbi:MAG: hypothetical protein IKF42_09820 [Mogibacterium sp.]|nr:hypothetical protein [Mogibacterium sp.]
MKKNLSRKTLALIAAAALLFAGGTFTGTRAVLNIFSPEHFLEFETSNQAVRLMENGSPAGQNNPLLSTLGGKVNPGMSYKEEISARNDSDVSQFVRIVVRKYWKDKNGNKAKDIDKSVLDKIQLAPANTDVWQKNPDESTAEREVYYYRDVVPTGGVTKPLSATIKVDSSVAKPYTTDPKIDPANMPVDTVITYVYDYDGYKVCIEAEAQSIQTHNAQAAVRSIWGVTNVTATDSALTVR